MRRETGRNATRAFLWSRSPLCLAIDGAPITLCVAALPYRGSSSDWPARTNKLLAESNNRFQKVAPISTPTELRLTPKPLASDFRLTLETDIYDSMSKRPN
jgi:hypothetical protein